MLVVVVLRVGKMDSSIRRFAQQLFGATHTVKGGLRCFLFGLKEYTKRNRGVACLFLFRRLVVVVLFSVGTVSW